jgi:hypothetical protein
MLLIEKRLNDQVQKFFFLARPKQTGLLKRKHLIVDTPTITAK